LRWETLFTKVCPWSRTYHCRTFNQKMMVEFKHQTYTSLQNLMTIILVRKAEGTYSQYRLRDTQCRNVIDYNFILWHANKINLEFGITLPVVQIKVTIHWVFASIRYFCICCKSIERKIESISNNFLLKYMAWISRSETFCTTPCLGSERGIGSLLYLA
jgi:hypothetical protein